MLFRLDYAISVENAKAAQQRFATMDEEVGQVLAG